MKVNSRNVLILSLIASLVGTTVQAQDRRGSNHRDDYRGAPHRDGNNDAAIAIGAGLAFLGLAALAASSNSANSTTYSTVQTQGTQNEELAKEANEYLQTGEIGDELAEYAQSQDKSIDSQDDMIELSNEILGNN